MRVTVLLTLCLVPAFAQEAARPLAILNGLGLNRYGVEVAADDSMATVVVTEEFYNPGAGLGEADFYFPLPAGTAVNGLQLSMGDRFYGGNLLTRRRAREIYGEITRRNRDPALLDCVEKDLYRCRVFPVPGHGTSSVKFSYRQPLEAQGSMRRLVVPLDAARFNRSAALDFSLTLHLKTESALQSIFCPTHDVTVRRIDAHEAFVELAAKRAYLARDLVLLYSVENAPIGAVVSSYKRAGEPGYFVLSLDAAFAREAQEKAPRDVVLAVDTSNSAGRNGVDAAAAAVADALETLRPVDRFALVAFSTEARPLTDFCHPGETTGQQVRALFAGQPVAGRTRLGPALAGAAALASRGLPGTGIIVLTDGHETESGDQAAAIAARAARDGHRVGVCGIGDDVDTVRLDWLGGEGRGDAVYGERTAAQGVRYLLDTTRTAPLSDVSVSMEGVSRLYPERLDACQPGDTILVAGRYHQAGPVDVHVRGIVGGELVTHDVRVELRERGGDPAVARLWAARRIGTLLEEARTKGDPALNATEIRRLGRRFGIVTPHTSLLVLEQEDQQRYLQGMRRQPLLNSAGGTLKRRVYTRAVTAAELGERIKKLMRAQSGAVSAFDDLLGANRDHMRAVDDIAFYLSPEGTWVQEDLVDREPAAPREVRFGSPEWEALAADPGTARFLALGRAVFFTLEDGSAVRVLE